MALFGSDNKTVAAAKIRPTIVRTQNVAKELVNIAKSNKVNAVSLDFNILEVETYHRACELEKDDVEWEDISTQQMRELDDATSILNPLFQLKQVYEIEVFSKNQDEDLFKDFHVAVGANATKCKVYLSIKPEAKLTYFDKFDDSFLDFINKSKIRAGILINIFDEMIPSYISKVSAQLKVEKTISFEKAETVLIANAYEPTLTIDDKLIIHYDEESEVGENDKVDHSKRGFIHSVAQDDVLIEYIKPQKGKPGRNCRGEFMEPTEPEVVNEPNFTVDDTIEIVDNKDNIEYKAKESGYVTVEGGVYQIKSDMDLGTIDFKTTGSISAGVDSDVALNVKENDAQKDAIGNGMEVEVSEIDIKGNIGSNAKVTAKRATIEGQTHKEAIVKADDLTVNVHKGLALGGNVNISRLEHGRVECDVADIDQAVGGDIKAKEISIEHCGSFVKATAASTIEIKKLNGNENVFTIDPLVQDDKKDGLDETNSEISQLNESMRDIGIEIEKYQKMIKNNTASINDIKKKLIHFKKNGIKMPAAFVDKYKQFQKMTAHLETITNEYDVKKDKLSLLESTTASFQSNIFDARVINRDRWIGHNEIVFKLVDPPMQIVYTPPEGCEDQIFGLVQTEYNGLQIQALDEDDDNVVQANEDIDDDTVEEIED
ncbi:FapA family protein [Sulfurimonas sp.]|nr:FapA family protein [Sulfurimonas sp.]